MKNHRRNYKITEEDGMTKILTILMLVFAICGAPFIVMAADIEGAEILKFGIYKADFIRKEEAPGAAAGIQHIVQNVVLAEQTTKIPARVGTRFGFEYVIKGRPVGATIDLTYKYLHPRMTNPETKQSFTSQEVASENEVVGEAGFIAYSLTYKWEAVVGEWTLQVFYGDKKLAEKFFYIYKP
jgi:hypothetical protein